MPFLNSFTLLLIFTLGSCNYNNSTHSNSGNFQSSHVDIHDTIDTSDPLSITELRNTLNDKMSNWVTHHEKHDSIFGLTLYKYYSTSQLTPHITKIDTSEVYSLYKEFLIWSPDSSRAIDLYSYGIVLSVNQEGEREKLYDVDNRVSIIDSANNSRTSILFNGPSGVFEEACWIGDSMIVIATIEYDYSNSKNRLFLSAIDLANNTNYTFDCPECIISNQTYIDQKFEHIKLSQ